MRCFHLTCNCKLSLVSRFSYTWPSFWPSAVKPLLVDATRFLPPHTTVQQVIIRLNGRHVDLFIVYLRIKLSKHAKRCRRQSQIVWMLPLCLLHSFIR